MVQSITRYSATISAILLFSSIVSAQIYPNLGTVKMREDTVMSLTPSQPWFLKDSARVRGNMFPDAASTYSLGTEALPWWTSYQNTAYVDTVKSRVSTLRTIVGTSGNAMATRSFWTGTGWFQWTNSSSATLTSVDTIAYSASLDFILARNTTGLIVQRKYVRSAWATSSDQIGAIALDTMYSAANTMSEQWIVPDILRLGGELSSPLARGDTAIGLFINYPITQISGDVDINGGLLSVDTTNTTIIHASKIRPVTSGSTTVDFDSSLSMSIGNTNSYSGLDGTFILGAGNTVSSAADNSMILGYTSTIAGGASNKRFITGGHNILLLANATSDNSYQWASGYGIAFKQGSGRVFGISNSLYDTVNISHKDITRNISHVVSSAADTNAYGFQGYYIHWPYAKDSVSYYVRSKRGGAIGRNVVSASFDLVALRLTPQDSTFWSPTGEFVFLRFDTADGSNQRSLHFNVSETDWQSFGDVYIDQQDLEITAGDLRVNGGDMSSTASTFNLLATPTTVNIGAAGTTIAIGALTGTTTINNDLTVGDELLVSGVGTSTITGPLNAGDATDSSSTSSLFGQWTINGVNSSTPTVKVIQTHNTSGEALNLVRYGAASAFGANIIGWRYGGTPSSPVAVGVDTVITGLYGAGYNGTSISNNVGAIRLLAREQFTTSSAPTYWDWAITQSGATTRGGVMALYYANGNRPELRIAAGPASTVNGNFRADSVILDNTIDAENMVIGTSGTNSNHTVYFGSGGYFLRGRSTSEYVVDTMDASKIATKSFGKDWWLGTSDAQALYFYTNNVRRGGFLSTGVFDVDSVVSEKYVALSTGSAPIAGNATLVAGTVTVSTTAATADCIVMLTRKTSGGTIGTAITYTISAGTSFTITSDNVLDTSTFSWFIVRMY